METTSSTQDSFMHEEGLSAAFTSVKKIKQCLTQTINESKESASLTNKEGGIMKIKEYRIRI